MKNIFVFILFVTLLIAAISCNINDSPTSPPPTSWYLIHTSPDAPNVDVYDNGNPVTVNFPFGRDTGYFSPSPGAHEFKIAQTGTSTFLVDEVTSLEANKLYSIFVIDSLKKIRATIVQDNFNDTSTYFAKLRFLQLSPNTPNSNAQFSNSIDTITFVNRSFNDQSSNAQYSPFSLAYPGTYQLKIITTDSTATTLDSFPNISLTAGKAYTVYLKGFYKGPGSQALSMGILKHTN